MHQNVVNIRAELDTRKEVEDELVGGELESFEPINVDVLVRVYDPKNVESFKRRFAKITQSFNNHGEGPYKGLLMVESAYYPM